MLGVRKLVLIVAALFLAAPRAGAQSAPVLTANQFLSTAQVTAGVSLQGPSVANAQPTCQELAVPCIGTPSLPDGGLAISVTMFPNEIVGIVGEASVFSSPWTSYGTTCAPIRGLTPPTCYVEETNHPRAALAGLALRTPLIESRTTRMRLFAQALVGPQWTDIGPRRRVFQPGVGLDGYLLNGVAVRVEYDYRLTPDDRRDLSTGRVFVGVGFPIGLR